MSSDWRNRPKFITHCPEDIHNILFVDESGDATIKNVVKNPSNPNVQNRCLTVAGVAIDRDNIPVVRQSITDLKNKYWVDGCYYEKGAQKRVCFHSRDIRINKGTFNSKHLSDYNGFMQDLTRFMAAVDYTIISSYIDKHFLYKKYGDNLPDPYHLSMEFIVERYFYYLRDKKSTGVLVVESRGAKEDNRLFQTLKHILDNGNKYINGRKLQSRIKGVYFNTKYQQGSHNLKSFYGLEIADLVAHPIHKYCGGDKTHFPFRVITPKLYGFDGRTGHIGKGLKVFP